MPPSSPTIGRLAPSPTGGLHLGHARTFLLAWLAARSSGGRLILRVEDIDASRVRPGVADEQMLDLRWLGLNWDEGPDVGRPSALYVQSRRFGLYDEALARLRQAERVYPCTCTRAEIERAASAPHASDEGPAYPGTCAHRRASDADGLGARPFAWRFRVSDEPVAWDDFVHGPTTLDPCRLGGDFLVGRSNGTPGYQLAVVVDDAGMGINQVVRGDDLVPSTPRQILLHRALGFTPPRFGHVPLAVSSDGRRLAKRDGSIKLATLREAGVDAHRLIGELAVACGLSDEAIPSTPADWIDRFAWERLPKRHWEITEEWLGRLASDPKRP